MTDPRYQVFVSSTYTDLVEERQAVISALLQLGAMPAGMELFPAADDEAWTLIRRVIDESDYYLLVIGGRYGSTTEAGISFTEMEYDYAVSQAKPVMAFLHGNPDQIAVGKSEIEKAARDSLLAFRAKVEKAKHVKFWTSGEDLAGKIALTFASFPRTYPSAGWIRGDSGDSPETLQRLATAQLRIAELESAVGAQASGPPPGSAGLADNDELLEVEGKISIEIANLNRETSKKNYHQSMTAALTISWNELIREVGPLMVNEAAQPLLARRFQEAVNFVCNERARALANDWLRPQIDGAEITGHVSGKRKPPLALKVSVGTNRNDFETALLQLEALGVVRQSERKRQIRDTETYWTLTPWGRTRLTRLRAVRSGLSKAIAEPPE